MSRRAVFLDRDGTLIEDPGYLNDPAQVRLLPGVGQGLAQLHQAGFLLIVVTNQSGLARGLITLEQYHAVALRLEELVRKAGGRLDAQYFCPHLPELTGPCECRKPGSLLFRQAIEQWGIDPTSSWWIGDRIRDLAPGSSLGGRTILVGASPGEPDVTGARETGSRLVSDFEEAVAAILDGSKIG